MAKSKRAGGKFSGNHTTLIPLAHTIADIASACESVYRISPGLIKAGLRSVRGQRRVKITDEGTCITLAIRDNTSQQTVHVYARDNHQAKFAVAQGARDKKIHVAFEDRTS